MRELDVSVVRDTVARLCIEANTHLPADVKAAILDFQVKEDWAIARNVLDNIVENIVTSLESEKSVFLGTRIEQTDTILIDDAINIVKQEINNGLE